jgi:fructose-1,6-bisphosphatase/inositol monophosphatase family enzyme
MPAEPSRGPLPSEDLYRPLRELLVQAGAAALEGFRRDEARLKADGTEVTDADRAAEAILVDGLVRAYPEAAVESEEGRQHEGRDGGTWYVDPIDGTSAFLDGLAHWGPTVAFVRNGALLAGALWLPRIGEFWYAERGRGAWRDDVRLSPADPGPPGRHHSLYLPSRYHRRMPFEWPGKVRALGSSAAHLAQVAGGGGVATVIPRWETWDVGCGILLVEEAGRTVSTLTGEPFDPMARRGEPFVAGTPAAVQYLTRRLASG